MRKMFNITKFCTERLLQTSVFVAPNPNEVAGLATPKPEMTLEQFLVEAAVQQQPNQPLLAGCTLNPDLIMLYVVGAIPVVLWQVPRRNALHPFWTVVDDELVTGAKEAVLSDGPPTLGCCPERVCNHCRQVEVVGFSNSRR